MKDELEPITTNLEIDEHIKSHKVGYSVQRVGLIFIIALALAAALGLFGDGVLSKVIHSGSNARLEYDRFYRFEGRMELKVELMNTDANESVISFPNEYLKNFKIESITPEPNSNRIEENRVHYAFPGYGDMQITFYLVPQEIGSVSGSIQANKETFPVHHFIFP